MPNNRSLIVVNSVYQLMTAVHLKQTLLEKEDTDLLLTDNSPGLKGYAPRLETVGLFRRIFFAATKELNKKYTTAKEKEITQGFQRITEIFPLILTDELGMYTQIYFANFDVFTRMLACRYDCEFHCFEDGFSTYVIDYLRESRASINRHPEGRKLGARLVDVLLYEPRLAMRGEGLTNRPLPKIQMEDDRLREMLNFIFDYHTPEPKADFLFLEQSFRAEKIKSNDLDLIRECQQTVGASHFAVKPHPRNPENLPYQLGLTRKYTSNAPWELFLFNEAPAHFTIVTVCSNAALTSRIVFDLDINTVMLYELFEGKVLWQEDAILRRYLYNFHTRFAGRNYYVPKTIYELRYILRYLGGEYGPVSESFGDHTSLPGGEFSGKSGGFSALSDLEGVGDPVGG